MASVGHTENMFTSNQIAGGRAFPDVCQGSKEELPRMNPLYSIHMKAIIRSPAAVILIF